MTSCIPNPDEPEPEGNTDGKFLPNGRELGSDLILLLFFKGNISASRQLIRSLAFQPLNSAESIKQLRNQHRQSANLTHKRLA